jgi:hypothetical protein
MSNASSDRAYMNDLASAFARLQVHSSADPHPGIAGFAADNEDVDDVEEWLAGAVRLEGLPFNHLVANPNLLPQDAIRFFYVDRNWLNALVDGALSVGVQSSADTAVTTALHGEIAREAHARAPMARWRRRRLPDETAPPSAPTWTGFLLRSPIVYTCPGLEVSAFATATTTTDAEDPSAAAVGSDPLHLIRFDRLAPDVLLAIFNGVPALVQINEPLEGLAFGTQDSGTGQGQFQLRGLGEAWSDGTVYWDAGQPITQANANVFAQVSWRDPQARTVDVATLAATLATTLAEEQFKAHQSTAPFGPADLALQLIRFPEQKQFSRA